MKFLLTLIASLLWASCARADQFDLPMMENMCQPLIVAQRVIGYDKDGVDFLGRRVCPNDWQPGMPFAGCKKGDTIVAFYGQALDDTGHFDGQGNLGRTAQFSITLKEDATSVSRGGTGCIDTAALGSGNPEPGLCVGPDKALSLSEVIGSPEVDNRQDAALYLEKGKLYLKLPDGTRYRFGMTRVRR